MFCLLAQQLRHRQQNQKVSLCQWRILRRLRPGVDWRDMHALANRTILERFTAFGLLTVKPHIFISTLACWMVQWVLLQCLRAGGNYLRRPIL